MPRLDVRPTDYGVFYSARRTWDDEFNDRRSGDTTPYEWHRINQFIFPFHSMITGGNTVVLRSFVPLDDNWAMLITQRGSLTERMYDPNHAQPTPLESQVGFIERTSDPRTYFMTRANRLNDYNRDYEVERTQMVSGVPAIGNLQDRAMTELMANEKGERIYDRSHEHLGSLDIMVIAVRRQLLKAVKAFSQDGVLPPNVDDVSLDQVRPATVVLPVGADWVKETEPYRRGGGDAPVAWDIKPLHYLQPEPIEAVGGGGA
jgi:hypothetical protein